MSFERAERVRKRINQKSVITDSNYAPGAVRTKCVSVGGIAQPRSSQAGRLGVRWGADAEQGTWSVWNPEQGVRATGTVMVRSSPGVLLSGVWCPFFAFNNCI